MLTDLVHANILENAGIWGRCLSRSSVMRSTTWNRQTHTFVMKTGELYYNLLDVNEIAGLPTYGSMYDKHLPERSDMSNDLLQVFTEFKGLHYKEEFTKKHSQK